MTACATTNPERIQTIEVPKPVVQRCVRVADIPPFPILPPLKAGDIKQRATWAQLRDKQLRDYIHKLQVLLIFCAEGEGP